ncbi:MAG: hypothetical protein KDN22_01305 [Verrucomicrobiae bacterium]|nr:hypothetical protein [Verrucomicrobiae bacterium]
MKLYFASLALATFAILPGALAHEDVFRITEIAVTDGGVPLSWFGSADYFEIQVSPSLTPATWEQIVRTEHRLATVPPCEGECFLRGVTSVRRETKVVVPDSRRLEVISAISDRIDSLPGEDGQVDSKALAACPSSIPELGEVGIHGDTSVHVQFRDERPPVIVNSRIPARLQKPGFSHVSPEVAGADRAK